MQSNDVSLMAHLMRRAGFGASRNELDTRLAVGYQQTVEDLLYPEKQDAIDEYVFLRYHPAQWKPGTLGGIGQSTWVYRMLTTKAPLEEKIALFWHHVFATGVSKVDHWHEVNFMIEIFRKKGLGPFRDIITAVAKNPAMIYWLDNNENHSYAVNENWGRELLELFSMGATNYTEKDVYEVSRAFTGWTITPKIPRFTMGRFDWSFEYKSQDHDAQSKIFLGHTGDFDGKDVIEIILTQPACSRFIARHIYNFFVADEPQVPAWPIEPPQDPDAIDTIVNALVESDYDIRHVLRIVFNSDFFKQASFKRIKSPAEVVVNTLRFVGEHSFPGPHVFEYAEEMTNMGQELLNPPTVEGWHTGKEWLNTGSLVKRANFFADTLSDLSQPGVRAMLAQLKTYGDMSPEKFVSSCLEILGPIEVNNKTFSELVNHAKHGGTISWNQNEDSQQRFVEMIQLIVATREFQFS